MGTQPPSKTPPPPPEPPRESFARRYKFLWPLLLTVNLAVGAYLFMRTKRKEMSIEEVVPDTHPAPAVPVSEKIPSPPPITAPVILRDPIPENQQRELFKWLLEEKRKLKPKDPEEKKRIDEEKAILKQFIRAKSIPDL
ncbi:glycine hydroxymethyltransferase [Sarracenia purpurea var. burkii]